VLTGDYPPRSICGQRDQYSTSSDATLWNSQDRFVECGTTALRSRYCTGGSWLGSIRLLRKAVYDMPQFTRAHKD
jgi:hypothetical protein